MLDFTPSPERLALQQKARDFALKEILPVAWNCDGADPSGEPPAGSAWRCRICGHVHGGRSAPQEWSYGLCPQSAFEKAA